MRRAHTVRPYVPRVPADHPSAHVTTRHYEIRVEGRLTPLWSAWLDGFTIETDASDGTTVIAGQVVDQAALHGLLQKLRDVGLALVSLAEVAVDAARTTGSEHASTTDLNTMIVPRRGDTQARRIP